MSSADFDVSAGGSQAEIKKNSDLSSGFAMTLASDEAFENVIENAVVGASMFVEIQWLSSSDQEKFLS